jgi:hypothetical protein
MASSSDAGSFNSQDHQVESNIGAMGDGETAGHDGATPSMNSTEVTVSNQAKDEEE